MKLAPGAATDLAHPEDMDGVGRGAGLCVVHSEAGEAEPKGVGRRRARGRQEESEEEEQQGWRHSAPKSTCKGKVGSLNISIVEYTLCHMA